MGHTVAKVTTPLRSQIRGVTSNAPTRAAGAHPVRHSGVGTRTAGPSNGLARLDEVEHADSFVEFQYVDIFQ